MPQPRPWATAWEKLETSRQDGWGTDLFQFLLVEVIQDAIPPHANPDVQAHGDNAFLRFGQGDALVPHVDEGVRPGRNSVGFPVHVEPSLLAEEFFSLGRGTKVVLFRK